MQTVAERMAQDLEDVRYGCVVEGVDWSGPGVQVRYNNDQLVEADAVIMTVSLGVLKVRQISSPAALCRARLADESSGPAATAVVTQFKGWLFLRLVMSSF